MGRDSKKYGSKLVENIIQAIIRDMVMEAKLRMVNMRIMTHIYDEVVISL